MQNTILRTILRTSFCALLLAGADALAQERPALVTRVERAFAEKEPRWKPQERLNGQSGPELYVLHLKSAQGDALVYLWLMNSEKTAGEVFEGQTIAFGNGMGARGRKRRLPDFADENYLWTGFAGSTAAVDFREGGVYVRVIAPSRATALRFARHVLRQINEEP